MCNIATTVLQCYIANVCTVLLVSWLFVVTLYVAHIYMYISSISAHYIFGMFAQLIGPVVGNSMSYVLQLVV